MNAKMVNIAFAVATCSTLYIIYVGSKSLLSRIAALESDNTSFKLKHEIIWKITTIPQILNCAAQILQWVIAQQPKEHSSNAFGASFGADETNPGNYSILETLASTLFNKSAVRFQAKARRIIDHRNTSHHACSLGDLDAMVAMHLEVIRAHSTEVDTMIRPAKLSQGAKALRDAVITIEKYEFIRKLLSEKSVQPPSIVSDTTDSQEGDGASDTEMTFSG